MNDLAWTVLSLLMLASALGACALLHHLGLATTYVRDLLHVGTGVWVMAWPLFQGRALPLAIVLLAWLATLSVPLLSRSSAVVARVHDTFSGGDERWSGLSFYTLAYVLFTYAGLTWDPFPAAVALLSLSLGDGIGGLVGRRFGRHHFRAPGGKQKSFEGSLTVAAAATLGVFLASWRFGTWVSLPTAAGLGLGAAVGEAVSPRGSDNLVVPAVVFGLVEVST